MDAKRSLVRKWLIKARRDLLSARRLARGADPYLDTAIYHCQQCAEKAGTPMTPDEQIYFDEQLKAIREKMDTKQFNLLWTQGRAMTMERAIEFALQESK